MADLPSEAARRETLPRALILRRRAQLHKLRMNGRRRSNRWMTLFFQPQTIEPLNETACVAFLTPKKIGQAVTRNLLRRRMREIYRRHLKVSAKSTLQLWVARAEAAKLSFADLKEAMMQLALRKN